MNKKGFSLAELMVAITILGIIMAGVVMVMINSDRAKRKNDMIIEAQQQGGAALEMLVRDIRTSGYGIPMESDQPVIAYATPFEIIFNSNLNPWPDSLGQKQPRAYDPNVNPTCPNYSVGIQYGAGVETYRYTFDSDNSGTFAAADRADDVFERKTINPNDVVLLRQAYGKMDDNTNNVYPTRNFNIALVRGPASATDTSVIPMFQYWYRNTSGVLQLVGDSNGDTVLTGNERLFANPSTAIISSIELITITVTTETRSPVDGNRYRRVTVSTTTNLANVPNTTAKYSITGKLVVDGSGTFIQGGKVYLNTGALQTSVSDGTYNFAVEAGSYTVMPEKLFQYSGTYYVLKNPQDSGVTVTTSDITDVDFRYVSIASGAMGAIGGKVYNDTLDTIGGLTVGERGITGVIVSASGKAAVADSTTIALSTTTDALGDYSFALPRGIFTITETDSVGYFSTTPNTVVDTISADGENDLSVNFGDSKAINIIVWKDADKDTLRDSTEALLPNVFCAVFNSNSGNIVASGRTDGTGKFFAYVPGDSIYTVMEIDPDSMVSTCALSRTMGDSTSWVRSADFNKISNLSVPKDSTRYVMFGDVPGFVAIALGQTEKVLSLATPNCEEYKNPPGAKANPQSAYADNDIVLGTVNSAGLISNLLVWYNRFGSPDTTPNALFPANYDRSYNLSYDITALATGDLDNPSITDDVICGLVKNTSGYNISVGLTHDGGGSGVNKDTLKGLLRYSVRNYSTFGGSANETVLALATGGLTNSNEVDFVVGTKDDENLGHIEIWRNRTGDTTGIFDRDTVMYHAGTGVNIGEVHSIYLADVVDSTGSVGNDVPKFYQDLIIGTKTGSYPSYSGQLIIFRRKGFNRRFELQRCYNITDGYINSVAAYLSGHSGLLDIVCGLRVLGSAEDDYRGRIDLWFNNGNGTFGASNAPNQTLDVYGEVLALATGQFNGDNINDIAFGVKIEEFMGGTRLAQCSAGQLPSSYSDLFGGQYTGEVVTVNAAPLRPTHTKPDIIVGERFEDGGVGYGRVIIYFNTN